MVNHVTHLGSGNKKYTTMAFDVDEASISHSQAMIQKSRDMRMNSSAGPQQQALHDSTTRSGNGYLHLTGSGGDMSKSPQASRFASAAAEADQQ